MQFEEAWDDTCSRVGLAARTGNLQLLRQLINKGSPLDVEDNRGWRPLHEAVFHNKDECVKELLKHSATNVNWRSFEGVSALLLACSFGFVSITRLLLKAGADPNLSDNFQNSPLIAATKAKSLDCVKLLVKSNAQLNCEDWTGWTAIHAAAQHGAIDIVEFLISKGAAFHKQDSCLISPVFTAAQYNQPQVLKFLLQKAFELHKNDLIECCAEDGASPLMIACQNGSEKCIEILLEHNADVNKKAYDGITALHLAVQRGHTRSTQLLLQRLSYENLKSFGSTLPADDIPVSPLHLAVEWKRTEELKMLLESHLSADTLSFMEENSILSNGCIYISPLALAASKGDVEICQLLLSYKASVNSLTLKALAPLSAAVNCDQMEIVDLLIKCGSEMEYCNPYFCQTKNSKIPETLLLALDKPKILNHLMKKGLQFPSTDTQMDCLYSDMTHYLKSNIPKEKTEYFHLSLKVLKEYLNSSVFNILTNAATKHTENDVAKLQNSSEGSGMIMSLQKLTRIKIREVILKGRKGRRYCDVIDELPIASPLKCYLLFQDMNEFLMQTS